MKRPPPLRRAAVIALAAGLTLASLTPPVAAAPGPQPLPTAADDPSFKALIYSETAGFVHDSVAAARQVWTDLAAENNFEAVHASDSTPFTEAGLAEFDVIVLANTSGDVWNAAEEAAFEGYVRGGGGVVAVHNPLDMEQGNAFYRNLIGTEFTAHSAANTAGAAVVVDRSHPSNVDLPERWEHDEEWYGFTKTVRGDKHVLLQMDPTSVPANTPGRMPVDHPVTWCSDYEGGQTWITSLGHDTATYADTTFRSHLLGGIRYAAGDLPGDCKATAWDNYDKVALDTNTSAPWGIAIADDGRVFFTELVRGQVRIYDPALQSTVTAATIPVYGGGEDGLLGLALHNDFATNQWIYVYYSPAGTQAINRLSRFTMSGNTMQLDTEEVMLEIPAGRGDDEIGHTGGTLRMDGQGNLWLSVGDDVVPFESSGYTPIDERPGRSNFDAQGTSANSNDLRGKLLRITPEDDGTYSIPAGNMFPEDGPDADKTLPEIYAMGFRNPFRYSVDSDGTVYLADYGPDAGAGNPTRGPAGYVEWQVITEPGNYGWPYCHADNIAYNDYDFATSTAGPTFDCAAPTNTSPNNTGLTTLPPAIPSDVQYSYAASAQFPQLGSGAGAPMAGPVYEFDPELESSRKWPAYFDGTPLFYEWGRNFIAEFPLGEDGKVKAINRVLADRPFLSPLDLQFGPDGALYLLEWGGGFGRDNPNSGLYRIDYAADGRAPTVVINADRLDGPGPLTVTFDSEGTFDQDGDELTYLWDFGDGTTSTEQNPTHTYTVNGTFQARLTVTELTESAKVGTALVEVTVGNSRPQVEFTGPPNGGFFEWNDVLPWSLSVSDAEGTVDCTEVTVQPALGHDDHAHPTLPVNACEGEAETILDDGHAAADAFWVLDARYTDDGGPDGAGPLTGTATNLYRPKRFQAQYWTEQNGVAEESNAAAEQGTYVGAITDGDWVRYEDMNFAGIDAVRYRVSAGPEGGGRIEMRLGSPTGDLVATTPVASTGGWFTFKDTAPTPITAPAGTHDVYLVFRSNAGVTYSMTLDVFEAVGQGVGTPGPRSVRTNTSTRGDWIGTYGEAGYTIPQGATQLPADVTVSTGAGTAYTWEATSTNAAALQVPPSGTTRRASTWFHSTGFDVQVGVPDGASYDMSLYLLSFSGAARTETLRLTTPEGAELVPARSFTDSGNGVWVTYRIDSSVKVELRKVSGDNAVLAGVFFDEPVAADTTAPVTTAVVSDADPAIVTLTAADEEGGTGVVLTQYRLVGSPTWSTYTAPVAVARTATVQTVEFRSVDGAGNEEGERTIEIPAAETMTPPVEISSATACLGGKAVLTVRIRHTGSAAVDLTVATPLGNKTFSNVAAGRLVAHNFAATGKTLSAGQVSVTVRTTAGGQALGSSTIPVAARTCA